MAGLTDINEELKNCIRLEKDALVLGGGISGIALSDALTRAGIHVTLVEKSNDISGGASCFASARHEADDIISGLVRRLRASDNFTLITKAELSRLDGNFGSFKAVIKKDDGRTLQVTPSVVAAATGYLLERNTLGLPDGKNICFFSDLAVLLSNSADTKLEWNGRPVSSVAFLLDLANSDIKIDSIAVLNQVTMLKERFGCEASVVCRDLKVSFTGGEGLYLKAREAGVLFYKYDTPPEFALKDGMVSLIVPDIAVQSAGDRERLAPDLIVLPESVLPGPDTEKTCRLLGINMGVGGYMGDDDPQFSRVRSNRRGIYIAGACRFPQDFTETIYEAGAAAQEVASMLNRGVYEFGPVRAEVDEGKCALCFTCPRLCPHGAVRIEKYAKQNVYRTFHNDGSDLFYAARVEPAACYGCGICVAECPARAIALRGEAPAHKLLARM